MHIQQQEGAVFGLIAPDGWGVINLIEVWPWHRSQGHGNRLLKEAIEFFQNSGCHGVRLVVDGDPWLVQWYERHGFCVAGDRMVLQF